MAQLVDSSTSYSLVPWPGIIVTKVLETKEKDTHPFCILRGWPQMLVLFKIAFNLLVAFYPTNFSQKA